jgi:hypothetical protein
LLFAGPRLLNQIALNPPHESPRRQHIPRIEHFLQPLHQRKIG